MSASGDLQKLLKGAYKRGWTPVRDTGKHLVLKFEKNGQTVTVGRTVSDHRAMMNIKKDIERAERDDPCRGMSRRTS